MYTIIITLLYEMIKMGKVLRYASNLNEFTFQKTTVIIVNRLWKKAIFINLQYLNVKSQIL